ncbi:MAG: ribonuclease III [Desulfobacterales bacterium]|nr:ribonuclease III [Desulfobacterales bacterium]MBF0396965.1 ribonuclease III [Desulfobacterales bacterium]
MEDLEQLEENLSYKFKNKNLLSEALCHSSFVNELGDPNISDNERFEFLGDSVLNLVISHILMDRYPDIKEGSLSRMRASLVNESQLAIIAKSIDLGTYIKLGKGESHSQGRKKKSILADAMEAIIAAIYIDSGFDAAFKMIQKHFSSLLNSITTGFTLNDYKSQLQELAQLIYKVTPQYLLNYETGPDHDKTFSVYLEVWDIKTEGIGKSKKMAEQDAARKALEILNKQTKKKV